MMNRDDLLLQIQSLIVKVTKQLALREIGIPGSGSVSELRSILDELTTLERDLDLAQGKITSKNLRRLSSAWIVTDSWQHGDPLGAEICQLDYLLQTQIEAGE